MSSALAAMYRIAKDLGLRTVHRDDTVEEATAAAADAGTSDGSLEDLRELPFVTIDYDSSWDLDQALFVRERDDGYELFYALADAAHFVRPGDAMFSESLIRGTSYYLPGLTLPMLPACLSEGTTSLLPNEDRRALTFRIALDQDGVATSTDIIPSVIRSQAKLTYSGVQHFLDQPQESPISELACKRSLELMAVVGTLRMQLAERRDVVRYDRVAVRLSLSADGNRVIANAESRNAVQMHNEQISLLCNVEGAKFLTGSHDGNGDLAGIFRLHDPPGAERLDELAEFIERAVSEHGVEQDRWRWRRETSESLADYVGRLPVEAASRRLAQAIQRQAMVAARPSYFATEPGPHYGIGAAAYSRFSAPMRELVGIITHHVALARLTSKSLADIDLQREQVDEAVRVANRAKELQKRAGKQAQLVALDRLFGAELERTPASRMRWIGTIMGVTESKIYVQLDDPPVDVKLYVQDLQGPGEAIRCNSGASHCDVAGRRFLVGAPVALTVRERIKGRWVLKPE